MLIQIDKGKRLKPTGCRIAVQGENLVDTHTFQLPRRFGAFDLSKYRAQLDYRTPDREPGYVVLSETMEVQQDVLSLAWQPDAAFTASAGAAYIQLVFLDFDNVIWRSEVGKYIISKSIMADGAIVQKYPTLLADMEQVRDEAEQMLEDSKILIKEYDHRLERLENISVINGGNASGR